MRLESINLEKSLAVVTIFHFIHACLNVYIFCRETAYALLQAIVKEVTCK